MLSQPWKSTTVFKCTMFLWTQWHRSFRDTLKVAIIQPGKSWMPSIAWQFQRTGKQQQSQQRQSKLRGNSASFTSLRKNKNCRQNLKSFMSPTNQCDIHSFCCQRQQCTFDLPKYDRAAENLWHTSSVHSNCGAFFLQIKTSEDQNLQPLFRGEVDRTYFTGHWEGHSNKPQRSHWHLWRHGQQQEVAVMTTG